MEDFNLPKDLSAKEYYSRLQEFEKCINDLGIETTVYDSDELEVDFPVLVATLGEDYKGDDIDVSAFLSPYLDNAEQNINFLQLSYMFDLSISKDKLPDMLVFLNEINSLLVIGNFVIDGDTISFRYTCSISSSSPVKVSGFEETFSIFSLLLGGVHEIICKLAVGSITMSDALSDIEEIFKQ